MPDRERLTARGRSWRLILGPGAAAARHARTIVTTEWGPTFQLSLRLRSYLSCRDVLRARARWRAGSRRGRVGLGALRGGPHPGQGPPGAADRPHDGRPRRVLGRADADQQGPRPGRRAG